MAQIEQQTIKIVIVGDGAVGKTTLVLTYVDGVVPGEYITYVAEKCTKSRFFNGVPFLLEIWDTPAQDGYDRLRPTCYTNTDVFFLCFSIAEPVSLKSITEKWFSEVSHHCPNTPVFLVGTKVDLRNDENVLELLKLRGSTPVTIEQGLETKESIGACHYIECSSLNGDNLENVFDDVLRFIQAKKRTKRAQNVSFRDIIPKNVITYIF
ncbi:ras-related C3 botulinum toxin substrate 1-like isoform X1 [Xenia sp. Carnegie-2017]|uniref:ras-related C3 botulinum toxin substrate 1-like isoform X1 n=1 Tax=Xenia sp. Carnegie-2017 TaxID=2897299 RepID=UPI001F04EAB5|nr:ras-related C3 botulinum toxin substrate 1-like isoform X1 [Xenia sp. Carnegie-2017]